METRFLFAAGLFAMALSAHAQSDTLRYEHDRMDSLVLENPGSVPQRIDSIELTRLQGSAQTAFFEFTLGDTLYGKNFGHSKPIDPPSGYATFRGATIPAGGNLTFSGRVDNFHRTCPCGDAGASPEPHLFHLEILGPGYRVSRFLKGTVATRSWMGIRSPESRRASGARNRHVRADGKTIGKAPRASLSFPIPAR